MNRPKSRLDDALKSFEGLPVPPPSAALEQLIAEARPVERRRPLRTLGLVTLASLLVLAIHVHSHYGIRRDFDALPKWWFWTMAVAWFAAFVTPLAIALVPRPGSMFADSRGAKVAAFAIPALTIVMTTVLRIDAPPATIIPTTTAQTLDLFEWCLVTGAEMAAVPFALGILVLLRAPLPLRTRWIGAALGAANGTLAGLMLHVHCWIGGALHAGVAHAGQAVIGAVVGALLVPALTRSRAE